MNGSTVSGTHGNSVVVVVVVGGVVCTSLGVVTIAGRVVASVVGTWVHAIGCKRLTSRILAYGDRDDDPIKGPIFLQRASSR